MACNTLISINSLNDKADSNLDISLPDTSNNEGVKLEYYSTKDSKVENKSDNEILKTEYKKNRNLKIGQYVVVKGRGNESSDGSSFFGYDLNNQTMMIVGIRENSKYPYACAIIDDNPSSSDIMAWFKESQLDIFVEKSTIDPMKKMTSDGDIRYYAPVGYTIENIEGKFIASKKMLNIQMI